MPDKAKLINKLENLLDVWRLNHSQNPKSLETKMLMNQVQNIINDHKEDEDNEATDTKV